MTKELRDGVEEFDGDPVDNYRGRFSGVFDVEKEVGVGLARDDLVTFVVTARCGKATLDIDKAGYQYRQNTFAIEEVTALDPAKARWMYDQLGRVIVGVNTLVETGEETGSVRQLHLADGEDSYDY